MPFAAKRPCGKPGCGNLVSGTRYCDDHADQVKQADRWRGSAASRGYDADWQRVRLQALRRDKYLCQNCLKRGRATQATEVHHLKKIVTHPHLRLVLDNLVSVDHDCHD